MPCYKRNKAKAWQHIRENAKSKGIFIDFINGYNDPCHCLVLLGVDQTIQKTIQLIKGESSFWINKHDELSQFLNGRKFKWNINILQLQFKRH
ncbi:transposase [Parasediminibacterium sp. JCM 36343]|uniref:transposase n=1 Tax=Parasediminibacterium sp. JCM 36343 TaxID=3374279 RepID=UPI0039795A00